MNTVHNVAIHAEAGHVYVSKTECDFGLSKVIGASFPFAPKYSEVSSISAKVPPEGLQAVLLTNTSRCSQDRGMLLFIWWEDEKCVIQFDVSTPPVKQVQFNPHSRSGTYLTVMHPEQKIVYTTNPDTAKSDDTSGQYLLVDVETILQYICKQITLDQLHDTTQALAQEADKMSKIEHERDLLISESLEIKKKLAQALLDLADSNERRVSLQRELNIFQSELDVVRFNLDRTEKNLLNDREVSDRVGRTADSLLKIRQDELESCKAGINGVLTYLYNKRVPVITTLNVMKLIQELTKTQWQNNITK